MSLSRRIRSLAATAGACLLAASALPAQEAPPEFGETIDVRVINLEAVVSGRDGTRVPGLGPGDFRLLVDGKETEIEFFTEVREGEAIEGAGAGITRTVPAITTEGRVGTSFLVFIDESFAIKRDRDAALERLIEQVAEISPEDRMAVVSFTGRKLEMLSNWNGDRERLVATLEAAKGRRALGLQRELLQRPPPLRLTSRGELESRRQRLRQRIRDVILGAETAMRSFAHAPGRRAMLLLAGGWPYNPLSTRQLGAQQIGTRQFALPDFARDLNYGPTLYRSLFDTANRLSFTLYPVDLRGFRGVSGTSAEYRTSGQARVAAQDSLEREWGEHTTLRLLAAQTGGRAFINSENRLAFAQALRDTRTYYWLGFSPNLRRTDRRHAVRLELRDPELEVRSRRSFSDLSRKTEVTMLAESALLFGEPPQGPKALRVEVGEPTGSGFRKMLLPIKIAIPLDALTFLPNRDGWHAQIELRVAVEDKRGGRNEIDVLPMTLKLPEGPPPGAFSVYETKLEMRRLRHQVVLSIHDRAGGEVLWTRLEVAAK